MKLFLFAERQIAFVQYSRVIISFRQNNKRTAVTARHGLPQLRRLNANDLHIFDFHGSEFPSKNVRIFILEKYTQKYFFSAALISKCTKAWIRSKLQHCLHRAQAEKMTLTFRN